MAGMGFTITLSVLLIVGALVGVMAQRRHSHHRPPSDLDAEAEANHSLVRLSAGLIPPDVRTWAGADDTVDDALTAAAQSHREARARLATARTAAEYAEVSRMAKEGLTHLRTAREALGLPSDPPLPALAATPPTAVPTRATAA